ncbi:putative pentatricopeptide repeat-containing protein At3g01580 [Andrographis paniculata]|uniref:putative pentatricopeptide repeat-containing protein At3g01580 n=1 Tax=Andrographis paniculata TaxID=175694 RepID=UPI0021E96E86|nr:putative pentatricopeptide repeat-containing protein At3g01580 [Andrographis paniculata]
MGLLFGLHGPHCLEILQSAVNGDFVPVRRPYMVSRESLVKLFESCRRGKCLSQLHSVTIRAGLTDDILVASKLAELYSKYTSFHNACKVFAEIPQRSGHVWSSILRCYLEEKRYKEILLIFTHMFPNQKPDACATRVALQACAETKAFGLGKTIHGFVKKKSNFSSNLFIGACLIKMYSKFGEMDDALCVFREYSNPDKVLWTAAIAGCKLNGAPAMAIELFARMVRTKEVGVVPDSITLSSVVSACTQTSDLRSGRSVHGYMIRTGMDYDGLSLSNSLLSLYGKTGSARSAAKLFEKMEAKDVISWGSMVACYAHHGNALEALDLFDDMVAKGIELNAVVLISALQACEATCDVERGRRIHKLAVREGLEFDILVATALIDMYMSCCVPDDAIQVFNRMSEIDAVCFSALLHGCVRNGRAYKSLVVFRDMLANDFRPDVFDAVKVLTACSEVGVLQQTSCVHGFTLKGSLSNDPHIIVSLIESYSKCGSLGDAIVVFEHKIDRDVVTWSSMVAAYGLHGKGLEALELFRQMIEHSSVTPNDVSFVSILSACSHAGLVRQGIDIYNLMVKDYKLQPNTKHYAIVVDLLGRAGELDKAMAFIAQMPGPVDANVWGALLNACRIYHNTEMGEFVAKKLLESDPCEVSHYILLSSMYAADKNWVDAAQVRNKVRHKELKVVSGQSVVEIRDRICTFVANDRSHQDFVQIHEMLTLLEEKMVYNDTHQFNYHA